MAAVDPTYPAFPIACSLATIMLLLVLLTSYIRQSWNLSVALLCFWLCMENLTIAVDAIVWSDNVTVKLYVWCDIVSHLQFACSVAVPVAPFLITRRLYLIVSRQRVESPSKKAMYRDRIVEWTLGFALPIVIAGPVYYVNQDTRFQIIEGFGCANSSAGSILFFVLSQSWAILPPVASIVLYYPKLVWTIYCHARDVNHFLRSDNSLPRPNYLRVLLLASTDILLTLPISLALLVLNMVSISSAGITFPFYPGWKVIHAHWTPTTLPYTVEVSGGPLATVGFYWNHWAVPVQAFFIFGLFGLTREARASYWAVIVTIGGWFGWKPSAFTSTLGAIEFGVPLIHESTTDVESSPLGSASPNASTNEQDISREVGLKGPLHGSSSGLKFEY